VCGLTLAENTRAGPIKFFLKYIDYGIDLTVRKFPEKLRIF
jgi:hypothetical protein